VGRNEDMCARAVHVAANPVSSSGSSDQKQKCTDAMTSKKGSYNRIYNLVNTIHVDKCVYLITKFVDDAKQMGQEIGVIENIHNNPYVLVKWNGGYKYAGKIDSVATFPNTETYVPANEVWLERVRKIYTESQGSVIFPIPGYGFFEKYKHYIFMGLAKISYLDGDERDYVVSYNKQDGCIYGMNDFGPHPISIYSSPEERPESYKEKINRVRLEEQFAERDRIKKYNGACKRFEDRKRNRNSKDSQGASGRNSCSNEPPNSYLCPITCELMMDPVIASDGFSYERIAIERWFSSNRNSPLTLLRLDSIDLLSNHGLKGAISEWLDN